MWFRQSWLLLQILWGLISSVCGWMPPVCGKGSSVVAQSPLFVAHHPGFMAGTWIPAPVCGFSFHLRGLNSSVCGKDSSFLAFKLIFMTYSGRFVIHGDPEHVVATLNIRIKQLALKSRINRELLDAFENSEPLASPRRLYVLQAQRFTDHPHTRRKRANSHLHFLF